MGEAGRTISGALLITVTGQKPVYPLPCFSFFQKLAENVRGAD
jgi:hypothetical protein